MIKKITLTSTCIPWNLKEANSIDPVNLSDILKAEVENSTHCTLKNKHLKVIVYTNLLKEALSIPDVRARCE